MAYSFTISYSKVVEVGGVKHYTFVVDELEATLTSEWHIDGMPTIGTITRYDSVKSAGSAVNMVNGLYSAAGASRRLAIYSSQTAAHEACPIPFTLIGGDTATKDRIYGRSGADAGSNNTIKTTVVIVEGHKL